MFIRFKIPCNDSDLSSGGGLSSDALASAVSDIGESLGFSADTNTDLKADDVTQESTVEGKVPAETTETKGTSADASAGGQTPVAKAEGTDAAGVATTAAGIPAAPKPGDVNALPDSWKPALKQQYDALPPELKSEIHRREADMFKGIEQWRQAADVGQRYHNAVSRFLPQLQVLGIDPIQHVGTLMDAHHQLSVGTPAAKADMFRRIGKEYGIDLAGLVSTVEDSAVYLDPAVKALQDQMTSLQSAHATQQRAADEARMKEVGRTVDAFMNDPANEHFTIVYSQMIPLIKGGADLKTAYEQAVWMNPATREMLVTKQAEAKAAAAATASAKAKAEEDARAKAAKKTSGFGVQSSPRSVGGAAKTGSMDDTLEATFAAINSREAAAS